MKLTSKKKSSSLAFTALLVAPATVAVAEAPQLLDEQTFAYNQPMLQNPASTAAPAADPMNVYISSTTSASDNSGNGSPQSPYNRFADAVARVADGGTIYIDPTEGAFLNVLDEGGTLPFIMDKNVTIKPANGAKNATLTVRAGGIILGADVKFENITLSFANNYHDSIFANGYRLDLINVTRNKSSRRIDLFTGSLHVPGYPDTPVYTPGTKGVIHIETNEQLPAGSLPSTFGNIYAGSMNGIFEWDSEITLNNVGNAKKIEIGSIYASGAHEADPGGMFDLVEPEAPEADSQQFYTIGDVAIQLINNQIPIDGTNANTSVTTSTVYPSNLALKNVQHVTIAEGAVTPVYENAETTAVTIPYVTVEKDATLDLTRVGKNPTIEHYNSEGTVIVKKDSTLHITNSMNGQMKFKLQDEYDRYTLNHTYVTTPTAQANITFEPSVIQSNVALMPVQAGNAVEWKIVENNSQPLPPLTGFTIQPENVIQTRPYKELNVPNADGTVQYEAVEFPFQLQAAGNEEVFLEDYPIELTVNGKPATYRADDVSYYADDVQLMMYFTSDSVNNYLVVEGQTVDGQPTHIAAGNYDFYISYENADGTVVDFTATLTVTDDAKTETSTVQFGTIAKPQFGDVLTIPVAITQTAQTTGAAKVYLHVNGQQIAQHDVTAAGQLNVQFDNVAVTPANHFTIGSNELKVTYSGTSAVNGSYASQMVDVVKASPMLTLNQLQPEYVYDYDGIAKAFTVNASNVLVSVAGETVANPEVEVYYKNIANASYTEERPVLPGRYETKIVVAEGPSYERAEIAGPIVIINRVKPNVHVTGGVKDGFLTLNAHVEGAPNGIMPNGEVEFSINGVRETANVVNGVATYTTADSGTISTYEVKANYTDRTIVDGVTVYDDAESTPISIHAAAPTVNVTGIELDESILHLTVDDVATLQAVVKPTNATNVAVIWHSDNPAIAAIAQDGTVTALSAGTATITVKTVDGGYEVSAVVHVKEKAVPPVENGGGETPPPPTENGGGPAPTPPTENEGVTVLPPPIEVGGGTTTPPAENENGTQAPAPPTENNGTPAPTVPPVEAPAPVVPAQPPTTNSKPSSSGGGGGGGGGSRAPKAPDVAVHEHAPTPPEAENTPNEFKVDLEGLDAALQTRVDSLVATVIAQSEQEFTLSFGGDTDDLGHVTDVFVSENGIFITVDGQQVKISSQALAPKLNIHEARAIRLDGDTVRPVMHKLDGDGLRITSNNLQDVLITAKVPEPFEDVAEDAWYADFVEELYNYGFTQGTSATTFSPSSEMTRAQFAVMIARALEMSGAATASTTVLADVENKWYAKEIQMLVDIGIISGYPDGTFKGDTPLTRQQAATMIVRMLQHLGIETVPTTAGIFYDASRISPYAQDAVSFLAENGVLMSGDGVTFNPHDNLTRAQMAKMLMQALRLSGKY